MEKVIAKNMADGTGSQNLENKFVKQFDATGDSGFKKTTTEMNTPAYVKEVKKRELELRRFEEAEAEKFNNPFKGVDKQTHRKDLDPQTVKEYMGKQLGNENINIANQIIDKANQARQDALIAKLTQSKPSTSTKDQQSTSGVEATAAKAAASTENPAEIQPNPSLDSMEGVPPPEVAPKTTTEVKAPDMSEILKKINNGAFLTPEESQVMASVVADKLQAGKTLTQEEFQFMTNDGKRVEDLLQERKKQQEGSAKAETASSADAGQKTEDKKEETTENKPSEPEVKAETPEERIARVEKEIEDKIAEKTEANRTSGLEGITSGEKLAIAQEVYLKELEGYSVNKIPGFRGEIGRFFAFLSGNESVEVKNDKGEVVKATKINWMFQHPSQELVDFLKSEFESKIRGKDEVASQSTSPDGETPAPETPQAEFARLKKELEDEALRVKDGSFTSEELKKIQEEVSQKIVRLNELKEQLGINDQKADNGNEVPAESPTASVVKPTETLNATASVAAPENTVKETPDVKIAQEPYTEDMGLRKMNEAVQRAKRLREGTATEEDKNYVPVVRENRTQEEIDSDELIANFESVQKQKRLRTNKS